MTLRVRSLLLMAIPAVALGLAAALLAEELAPPAAPQVAHPATGPTEAADPDVQEPAEERPRGRAGRGRAGAPSRKRLDPAVTAQLSDPDPAVRDAAALTLLRMGTGILDELHYVQPKSAEGAALLSRMEIALDTLRAIERGGDYGKLSPDLVLELRLRYWKTVVPESSLCAERIAHWSARVAGDETRVARGAMTSDEAALDALDLLLARAECGEIDAETFIRERALHLPGARRFIASLAGRSDLGQDTIAEYRTRIDAVERR